MALFKPGDKRPEGAGRKAGEPNKKTKILEEILAARDFCAVSRVLDIFENGVLDDKERADILLKIMEYVYPKRKAVEHSGSIESKPQTLEEFVKQQNENKE